MISIPLAFVLINTAPGAEDAVVEQLRSENVEVFKVYGAPYDLIAIVKANSNEKLTENISVHIRKLKQVTSTVTLLVTEGL